jgi:predicted dehydrogenase
MIDAVAGMDVWDIRAVADRDLQRAEQVGKRLGCAAFDDGRQFIIQNDFECLLVPAPLHQCAEFVRLALKKGIHILKVPPMARNFEEASALAELAAAQRVRYDVAGSLRYANSFLGFMHALAEQPLDKPFLLRLVCEVGFLPPGTPEGVPVHPDHEMAWVTDQSLAGGGVLLHDTYEWIDQMVSAFGLPQQVYALGSSQASDKQQLHHLTEDSVLMMLRFGERLAGEIVAVRYWDARDDRVTLEVHGRDRVMRVDPEQFCCLDSQGTSLEHTQYAYDPTETLRDLLQAYALSLLIPEEPDHRFRCDVNSQLAVMAVIEAAYLSCRTGSPESPGRILELPSR